MNFFRCCARAPAAAEWGMHSPQGEYNPPFGECRRQNPPRQREGNAECNEAQSRRRREYQRPQSHPSPRQRHTLFAPQTPPGHLPRAIHKETLRMAHNTLSTTDNRAHIAFQCLGAGPKPQAQAKDQIRLRHQLQLQDQHQAPGTKPSTNTGPDAGIGKMVGKGLTR